jgi:hypothetical protein
MIRWIRKLFGKKTTSVFVSKQSGRWDDPETWVGVKVPTEGSEIVIKTGHTVTFSWKNGMYIKGVL